jgi:galactose oxidase-like protein
MAVAALTGGALASSAGAASAHSVHWVKAGWLLPHGKAEAHALRQVETSLLGPEHAEEHAQERHAIRRAYRHWKHLSRAQRRRISKLQRRRSRTFAAMTAGDPSQDGQWTQAPFAIPNYAIHSVVMPTGKVLFWGYPPFPPGGGGRPNIGQASLWDPTKGTGASAFTDVAPPTIPNPDGSGNQIPAPIYCSSQSFLPTGAVLIAGGNLTWPDHSPGATYSDYAGIKTLFTFDPWTETWTQQPNMQSGRYYPSQVELGDGRVVIAGGYSDTAPGGQTNDQLEVFTPGSSPSSVGNLQQEPPASNHPFSLYPHLFTLPSGNVLLAGPGQPDSSILNTQTFGWQELNRPSQQRVQSAPVLLPGGPSGSSTVMEIGGMDLSQKDAGGFTPATATSESIDAGQPTPTWSSQSSLNIARANENAVLLPDGSMVAVGGGRGNSTSLGSYETYSDMSARQVELWDPSSHTWRLGPAQQEDRAYHSTGVLLPDGRVMSAGDDFHPSADGTTFSSSDTAEIYSPPYLFRGSRPTIDLAPSSVRYGDTFGVRSASGGISRAVLMAPSATTHAVDMQQRDVPLQIVNNVNGQGVDLVAPPGGPVAPPGYYMLFLLNGQGVPSVASWVRVGTDAPDQPTLSEMQGQGPNAAPPATAAGPQVGVALLRSHRALRRGRLMAQVSSNMPANITLLFSLHRAGRARKGAGPNLNLSLSLSQAGSRSVTLSFGRKALRRSRGGSLDVSVAAKDGAGNPSSWRGTLKL